MRGFLMTKRTKTVADGVLRAREAASPDDVPRWLHDLSLFAVAYLVEDENRPGAAALKEVKSWYSKFRRAKAANDPEAATWAAMRMLHVMWLAQLSDAQTMIESGVSQYRVFESKNLAESRAAEAEREEWRKKAAALRADPRHEGKSASDIARLIHAKRWNTVRRHIGK